MKNELKFIPFSLLILPLAANAREGHVFPTGTKPAGINNVYYESPGTAHEFLNWHRCLNEFVPLI